MMPEVAQPARPSTLYIVATPIGNRRDISLRALDVLRSVALVAAEDTRVSGALLAAYGIRVPLFSCREHNERDAALRIIAALRAGESVALVSDAGTPGISDPGARVVQAVREAGFVITPLPGPSAVTAVLSVAGIEGDWCFHGFLPPKAVARRKVLASLKDRPCAWVFYEAPHRILETVADLVQELGGTRRGFLGREVSKHFEQFHAASLADLADWLLADPDHQRGEFVLVVAAPEADLDAEGARAEGVLVTLMEELSPSQSARLAARLTGVNKSTLYARALALSAAKDAEKDADKDAD